MTNTKCGTLNESSIQLKLVLKVHLTHFHQLQVDFSKSITKKPQMILIKLTKIKHKEQLLKAAREKQQITHKGIPIRNTADLSIETLQARREWQDTLRVMKENNLQPRLLYPARISFRYEGEFRSFTDNQKLREFSTTKPALQQMQGSSLDKKHRKVV